MSQPDCPKMPTISSDLEICCWDGLRCNHPPHSLPEDMRSSDLSRYPPPMMLGLAGAISKKLVDIGWCENGYRWIQCLDLQEGELVWQVCHTGTCLHVLFLPIAWCLCETSNTRQEYCQMSQLFPISAGNT